MKSLLSSLLALAFALGQPQSGGRAFNRGSPKSSHEREPRHRCGECASCKRSIERAKAKRVRKAGL